MLSFSEMLNTKTLHLCGEGASASLKGKVVIYMHSDVTEEQILPTVGFF